MKRLPRRRYTAGLLMCGVMLLAAACGRPADDLPQVVIVQYVPTVLMDDGVAGIREGLAAQGYRDGETVRITLLDAQGDMGMLSSICGQVVAGNYDVAITLSTPVLQAMANANRDGSVLHIFGLVTDPFTAGVGLDRASPAQHPPHLAGIGTFEPVAETFRLAQQVNPGLQRVGVVYNAGEDCSRACVERARAVCAELGITLAEVTVDNSATVGEAVRALLQRDVQALWTAGDNTVDNAFAAYGGAARQQGVPVFTSNLEHVGMGAAFSYGADYRAVGERIGALAAQALRNPGSIATVPVANVVPQRLAVDAQQFAGLGPAWQAALPQLQAAADTGAQ